MLPTYFLITMAVFAAIAGIVCTRPKGHLGWDSLMVAAMIVAGGACLTL